MENISKQVLQIDGKIVGYVLDVAVDGLDKVGYYVADADENEYLIKSEQITKISKDFLLFDGKLEFVAFRNGGVLGKRVLDENLQDYGCIEELKFKKDKCEKIVTDKCEILAKYLKNIGENVVFVSFKRKKLKKIKNPFEHVNVDFKVNIQSVPEKIALSPSFYLGRISTQNIFGYNNEKIVLKNETVTKSIFEKAKKHNKLNQLFFALKR